MPRTPEYDRSHVVDQAMAVFWERGYGKTSICDLVAATGLKPGSLYAAFGSKKGIYLEVLRNTTAASSSRSATSRGQLRRKSPKFADF